jgi:hypothetical protein
MWIDALIVIVIMLIATYLYEEEKYKSRNGK